MTAYSPDPRDLTGRLPAGGEGTGPDGLTRAARYSRWDGTQRLPDLDADEILQALSDDVMAEGDIAEALRRLMDRGWRSGDPSRPDMPGLQDLMDRLARRRVGVLPRRVATPALTWRWSGGVAGGRDAVAESTWCDGALGAGGAGEHPRPDRAVERQR